MIKNNNNGKTISLLRSLKSYLTLMCMTAAVCVFALPSEAKALEVTFPKAMIQEEANEFISDYLEDANLPAAVQTEFVVTYLGKINNVTLSVLHFVGLSVTIGNQVQNALIIIDYDLIFGCPFAANEELVTIENMAMQVSAPALNPLYLAFLTNFADNMLDEIQEEAESVITDVSNSITAALNSNSGMPRVCPTYTVKSNKSVKVKLDFWNGCINGRTRHITCPSHSHIGPGESYLCVNGRWAFVSGWCEILPPDGGDPY